VAGIRVHQAFLGTCTNARLEDLAVAAQGIAGAGPPGTRLLIIGLARVLQDALRLGYLATLLDAVRGAGHARCGPCMGNHLGCAPREVTISSANRNSAAAWAPATPTSTGQPGRGGCQRSDRARSPIRPELD